jgi:hypothetical protein
VGSKLTPWIYGYFGFFKNIGVLMKRIALVMVIGIIAGVFISCVSSPPANSLGEVEARFESTDVLIGASPQQNQAMNQAGRDLVSGNARAGAAVAGIGLAVATAQSIANIPIINRLNEVAREALLAVAKEQHGEDIDIERIRFTLISQNQAGLYQYTARGFVVPSSENVLSVSTNIPSANIPIQQEDTQASIIQANVVETTAEQQINEEQTIESTPRERTTREATASEPERQTRERTSRERATTGEAIASESTTRIRYPSHPSNCCHNILGRR